MSSLPVPFLMLVFASAAAVVWWAGGRLSKSTDSLFLLAGLILGTAVLPSSNGTNLYLAALGVVLMSVYLVGLMVRSSRTVLRMGLDSWLVLAICLVGMYGLIFTD